MSHTLPIALDAMGGDNAPGSVIEGAAKAARLHPGIKFLIFGDEAALLPLIATHPHLAKCSTLVATQSVIKSSEKPSVALRQGKGSSMWQAIQAVKQGEAGAMISAGNTGALMVIAKLQLRTLEGVHRPALASILPTIKNDCVMLDLGANVECDGETLMQFAVMGDAFARASLGVKTPRIGLLNVGSEDMKGHEEVKAASTMIKALGGSINFHGFVEGDDIAKGTVDVVVTDGFSGNIALKTAEGTAKMITHFMKLSFKSSLLGKLGALLAYSALKKLRAKLDPRKYNGAMLLGLNGIVIKSHGGTDDVGFCNAIKVAYDLSRYNINERIMREIGSMQRMPETGAQAAQKQEAL